MNVDPVSVDFGPGDLRDITDTTVAEKAQEEPKGVTIAFARFASIAAKPQMLVKARQPQIDVHAQTLNTHNGR
jgi:hypothetical protein